MVGVHSATVSILTDEISQNKTNPNINEISAKNVDVFRQLMNQETIIRINLVKNVHALMKDMLTLQEKMVETEGEISRVKTTTYQEISELKKQVEFLKAENAALKIKTAADEKEIMILKENLENVSNTLTDVKVEVRYLSITIFGMNDDSKEINKRLQELENSTKEIENEVRMNDKNNTATLSDLEKRQLTLIGKVLFYYYTKLHFKTQRSNTCSLHYRLKCIVNLIVLAILIIFLFFFIALSISLSLSLLPF